MINPYGPTWDEAAALLGVSRATIGLWITEGRLACPLTMESVMAAPPKRKRGPKLGQRCKPLVENAARYPNGRLRWRERKDARTG